MATGGTVHKLAGPRPWSISKLAEEFGSTRETISKRIARAGIAPFDTYKGSPVYRLRDVARAILGSVIAVSAELENDPAQFPPNERLAWMRSESERLKVELAKANLVEAADCETQLATVVKRSVQILATLPDRLERECGLTPETVERIVIACDEARAEYHEELLEE